MASPSAVVEVEAGPAKGLSLTVTPTKTVPVGRDKSLEGCLRDQTISRTHGMLMQLLSVACAGVLHRYSSKLFVRMGPQIAFPLKLTRHSHSLSSVSLRCLCFARGCFRRLFKQTQHRYLRNVRVLQAHSQYLLMGSYPSLTAPATALGTSSTGTSSRRQL